MIADLSFDFAERLQPVPLLEAFLIYAWSLFLRFFYPHTTTPYITFLLSNDCISRRGEGMRVSAQKTAVF